MIPKDASDPKSLADTEEDMNVMAHILEKAASPREERSAQAMGIFIHGPFSGPAAAPQNLYIEGYGALFFLSVNYPLVAPPTPKKQEPEPKEETSSEWEDARRELYRPPETRWDFNASGVMALPRTPAEEYDAGKVETLKKDLISALKNAAHIRKLKSDESVTVVVTGRGPAAQMKVVSSHNPGSEPKPFPKESKPVPKAATGSRTIPARALRTPSEAPGTKLILRAKKSDIESFQKDKLNFDDFRKKVTLMLLEEP